MSNKDKKGNGKAAAPAFTKQQFKDAQEYASHRDVISALLKDDESYTHEQVNQIVDDFNGKVVL
ncbi:hypothetical protein [Paenibacillus eucommiae]|uniref:Ser/Thr protein kinase n=1 Tax=Paenibacillus eucommiae TaxID=1355755 RepID=A0ABS4IRL8_9BACL|nr:hypothetical protein [Paenibacillus eucommiae]MBP1990212.1 putative Ser/Thr protein kinase [Paenibacillus eucommiae]